MSQTIPDDYLEKLYAGWLGKIIGVRHGANIEGWEYERIHHTFGEITQYLNEFKNFAADDDLNGPIYFMRALADYTCTREITPAQMGLTLLNYIPDGHGFFWWGGYGRFTEHTAYLNLKNGIAAPCSGSIEQNGVALAEQIGGQIFSDVWGLLIPGSPSVAAEYAGKMASVTHDGNGRYGGMFIAACVSGAFTVKNVPELIAQGLSVIPPDCEYARMVRQIIAFWRNHPDRWRQAFEYVQEKFGYPLYPGVCHIIPNAAVVILSLLYGEGDFSKTINIANMCGWDTDCNVGNAGTIMGVRNGLAGIDRAWTAPINDFVCASGVLGVLNIWDIPSLANYTANLAYRIANQEPPHEWGEILSRKYRSFHFEYPGSTHAFRIGYDGGSKLTAFLGNTDEVSYHGKRSLKITVPNYRAGNVARVFYKTYYTPTDFNDSRYDPDFSPLIYPGQTVDAWVMVPESKSHSLLAYIYIKDRNTRRYLYQERTRLIERQWTYLKYDIPAGSDQLIEEVGIAFIETGVANPDDEFTLIAYLNEMNIYGKASYAIDFKNERIEKWTHSHATVSQMTILRGSWILENGQLSGNYCGEPAEVYSGDLNWQDYHFQVSIEPQQGLYHNINFRVQGAIRSYAVGLAPDNRVILYKNCNGYQILAEADYQWEPQRSYILHVTARGNEYSVSIDGAQLLTCRDDNNPYLYGQIGFSNFKGSHTHYNNFSVKVF